MCSPAQSEGQRKQNRKKTKQTTDKLKVSRAKNDLTVGQSVVLQQLVRLGMPGGWTFVDRKREVLTGKLAGSFCAWCLPYFNLV